MSPMNEFDLDRTIDRALKSYTAGEPKPDFAERIVAATRSRSAAMRNARSWALTVAAALACIAMLTFWMKTQHLEFAIVHTAARHPATSGPVGPQITQKLRQPAEAKARRRETFAPRAPSAVPASGTRIRSAGTRVGDEQLAEEGVEPIAFKPIEMTPIRMGASGQESQ